MGLRQSVLKAVMPFARIVVESSKGRSLSLSSFFNPGSRLNWDQKAGLIYDNSVVSIAINWMQRNFPDAPPVIERLQPDGSWKIDPKHPFVADWAEPNPWYGDDTLTDGLLVSLIASGNGYVVPLRRNNGRAAFVFMPHVNMAIQGGDGVKLIDRYEYTVPGSGQIIPFQPDQIMHFRLGNDLNDQKKGQSPLYALKRDVSTDNLGTTYAASLLNRMGVPGMIFTPAENMKERPTPEQMLMFKQATQDVFTGDGAGSMMVLPFAGKIEVPASGPESLALDKLQSVPTARILAALGLSDIALGLPSSSKTYDNYSVALEAAWENCLMPIKTRMARVLTIFVRQFYGEDETVRVWWDFTRVRALQPDLDKLFDRWSKAYQAGLVKRSEGKAALGLKFDTADEIYVTDATPAETVDEAAKALVKAAARARADAMRRTLEEPDAGDTD